MNTTYIVEMERADGGWFTLVEGICTDLSEARRRARVHRKKNAEHKNIAMRNLAVRVVKRIETISAIYP